MRVRTAVGGGFLICASLMGCAEPDEAPALAREASSGSGPVLPWLEFVRSTNGVVEFGDLRYFDVQLDGRILALDRMSALLHVVDLDGSHTILGGLGQGPGELVMPNGVAGLADGSILVFDPGNGRVTQWGPDGQVQDQSPAHSLLMQNFATVGSTIFLTSRSRGESEVGPGYDLVLSRWHGSHPKAADSVSLLASRLAWQVERSSDTVSCGPCPFLAFDDDRVMLGHPRFYLFRVVNLRESEVVAEFGRPDLPPVRHTLRTWTESSEREIEDLSSMARGLIGGRGASIIQERTRNRPLPDPLPFMSPLAMPFPIGIDGEGTIWVLRSTPEEGVSTLDLFGPDFEFLSEYRLPGHELTSIRVRGAFLVARSQDDTGVAEVRLFRIMR